MKIKLLMVVVMVALLSCNNTQPTDKQTSTTDASMSKAPDTTIKLRNDSSNVDSLLDSTKKQQPK